MSGALRLKAATSCVGSSRSTDLTNYNGALRYWVGWHAVRYGPEGHAWVVGLAGRAAPVSCAVRRAQA